MLATKRITMVLAWAILVISCDNPRVVGPSPVLAASPAPAPPVPTPPGPSEVWNISVRMTAVSGGACVGETLRTQMGTAKAYTLAMTPRSDDAVDIRLSSAAGDLSCTFPGAMRTAGGFTTFGQHGYFSCGPDERRRCHERIHREPIALRTGPIDWF